MVELPSTVAIKYQNRYRSAHALVFLGFLEILVVGSCFLGWTDGNNSRDKNPCQESLAVLVCQLEGRRLTVVLLHR
jgi:hypothetical protein